MITMEYTPFETILEMGYAKFRMQTDRYTYTEQILGHVTARAQIESDMHPKRTHMHIHTTMHDSA